MGAISLYRGNLHRLADSPRRWPMPQRGISLTQFRHLLRKRNLAISRFSAGKSNLNSSPYPGAEKGNHVGTSEIVCPKEVPISLVSYSEPSGSAVPSQRKDKVEAQDMEGFNLCETVVELTENRPILVGADSMEAVVCEGDVCVKEEVMIQSDATDPKEVRKREIEKNLDVLNAKKHYLVQMLKQILNAEEEIKRRSILSAAARSSVPIQAETSIQTSCASRNPPPKIVDVNFGGESDATAAANYIIQARQYPPMPATSPSTTSAGKSPFHHNSVRSLRGNIPHQAAAASSYTASVTASPSCFIPTTVSFSAAASSLSPATSGGTSSPFRDLRM